MGNLFMQSSCLGWVMPYLWLGRLLLELSQLSSPLINLQAAIGVVGASGEARQALFERLHLSYLFGNFRRRRGSGLFS